MRRWEWRSHARGLASQAVRRTVPPAAEIQASIDSFPRAGWSRTHPDAVRARSARRPIDHSSGSVEDEFDSWLSRARYERRPERPPGKRNGVCPRHVQTAEGELRIEIPQVRRQRSRSWKLFPK
jgi:hypothetical protein